ncbi:HAUS augmin-like complex subunit 6 isoform X2 [Syngnathoides biaculeatus]|uniref:HAUS augmin-like complex subunit 6 isoform X2 n=1 Tax=Syngnathoides biaculeatus TaxID=300417 RepID=UPI002ADD8F19|nr:HAUS augmin-like complex subunit 6 isoform X2 [Syngnathoides biaculeatus]
MACQTGFQKKNGEYLWFALLGLGFQPESHLSFFATEATAKHTNLGPNMFDKPNKDAFLVVIHFLLEKLNPTRFHQTYKYCFPLVSSKQDAEFRKETCFWLREIMDETGYPGSKVLMSLLLSPGGPKFTSLMVHLAMHVMLQEMKTFAVDGSWVPGAAAEPASSLHTAARRLDLIKKRFLREVVHQRCFLQDEHKRAQSVGNSLRDLVAESSKYNELLKKHVADGVPEEESLADKTELVRSLWSSVGATLSTTEQKRKVLESVLGGEADQYALDGAGWRLGVPRCLFKRLERPSQQLRSGKVYVDGQLNLLCALELFTHSLRLLKDERGESPPDPAWSGPSQLRERWRRLLRRSQELQLLRLKISMEEIPEVRSDISELAAQSDDKWSDVPFVSLLDDQLASGFLSPLARSQPSFDAGDANDVFSRFPAKLPENSSPCPPAEGERGTSSDSEGGRRAAAAEEEESLRGAAAAESSPSASALERLADASPPPVRAADKAKKQNLDVECDDLADQFADAVAAASPTTGSPARSELGGLLGVLRGDPFNTRKPLARTTETLSESLAKALGEDDAAKRDSGVAGSSAGTPKGNRRSLWGSVCPSSPFSLLQETLPELPSVETLLSFNDDDDDEEDRSIAVRSPQGDESAPDRFLSAGDLPAWSSERPSPPAFFSLDLDALDAVC